MSHITHLIEWISRVWYGFLACVRNKSCDTFKWDIMRAILHSRIEYAYSYVWRDSFICVTWLIQMCDVTHSDVWRDSFRCVTWLIQMCDVTHSDVWHDAFQHASWCDMTHSYVWHDSFACESWLIHLRDMVHSKVWRDSFLCVTYVIHMCRRDAFLCVTGLNYMDVVPHSHVWRDLFICVTWLIHMCNTNYSEMHYDLSTCMTRRFDTRDVILWYVWHDFSMCAIWLLPMCDITRICVRHDSHGSNCDSNGADFVTYETRLIHMCDMTHSYVWHDSDGSDSTGVDESQEQVCLQKSPIYPQKSHTYSLKSAINIHQREGQMRVWRRYALLICVMWHDSFVFMSFLVLFMCMICCIWILEPLLPQTYPPSFQ